MTTATENPIICAFHSMRLHRCSCNGRVYAEMCLWRYKTIWLSLDFMLIVEESTKAVSIPWYPKDLPFPSMCGWGKMVLSDISSLWLQPLSMEDCFLARLWSVSKYRWHMILSMSMPGSFYPAVKGVCAHLVVLVVPAEGGQHHVAETEPLHQPQPEPPYSKMKNQ